VRDLGRGDFDLLVLCVAGWIPSHAVVSVLSPFRHGAEYASALLETLAARLESAGYSVVTTPFGYFCEWDLSVYGESLAKVYKAL